MASCGVDELLDSEGNCYTCQMNEIIVNGSCACRPGYVKKDCSCKIECEEGYFPFAGQCGKCPVGMVYFPTILGCVCQLGFYLSPVTNICERTPILPSACNSTAYYSQPDNACLPCPINCLSCNSSASCTKCVNGFAPIQGVCTPQCGDGFIRGNERCDVGVNQQPGCQTCQITQGYSCSGEPSVCQLVNLKPPVTPPPNNTTPSGATLELVGSPSLNSNNIFIILRTSPTFTFPNPTAMQSFIQGNFSNTIKPSIYCAQENAPKLDRFDCLLIYPSGVPNSRFRIFFSYNYSGFSANTTVTVDPLAAAARSRRPN